MKNPRYNIITGRIDSTTYAEMQDALKGKSVSRWLADAVAEKIRNDRQNEIDMAIRAKGY